MITILSILYKTNNTFDYLDNQYESKLHKYCILIFVIVGIFTGGDIIGKNLFDYRPEESYESFNYFQRYIIVVYSIMLKALLGLLGGYLTALILYGISKILKGNGEIIHFIIISAYSMVPFLIKTPVIIYEDLLGNHDLNSTGLLIKGLHLIAFFWSLKIMIQGLIKYNKYGFWKTIINVCL